MSRGTPPAPPAVRAWEQLTIGSRWHIPAARRGSPVRGDAAAMDAMDMALVDGVYQPQWSSIVQSIDAEGQPTGELFWRLGGDGDYNGTEVQRLLLHAISGTTCPARTNTATDETNAQQWQRRCKTVTGFLGGTAAVVEFVLDKEDQSKWWPGPGHHYNRTSYVPGRGYVELSAVPAEIPPTPEECEEPYTGQTDPFEFGPRSYGINRGSSQIVTGIAVWDPSTGVWSRGCRLSNGPGGAGHFPVAAAEWNHTTGTLLMAGCPSSLTSTAIWEWDGVTDEPLAPSKSVAFTYDGSANKHTLFGIGAAIHWLEGDHYLFHNRWPANGLPRLLMLYDNSGAGAFAALDGTSGAAGSSDVINAAHAGGRQVMPVIDRAARKVYWLVPPAGSTLTGTWAPFRLYVSSFGSPLNGADLMNLVEVPVEGADALDKPWVDNDGGYGSRFGAVFDGHLWIVADAMVNGPVEGQKLAQLWRLPL